MTAGRLPFNAGKLRPDGTSAHKKSDAPISVSALAAMVDSALKDHMPKTVRVVGELSGFRERTHWYFDLKDAGAVINTVVFAAQARRLGFVPEQGQQVVATGRIDYYAKGGKLSLVATKLEPVGQGAHELELKRLTEQIRALGWLDADRKRRLPPFPRRVAVVTSRSSAALQDVIDTVRRRAPFVGLVTVDARVQGDAAVPEVAAAIARVGAHHERLGIDAIIVTRGGGSVEDLWCFNSKGVARAIVESPIPIVAAIGHETDTTLAELVADERAATPTQAAMRLTPDAQAVDEQLDAMSRRLTRAADGDVRAHGATLDRAGARFERLTSEQLARRVRRLEALALRLERVRPDRAASRAARAQDARLERARSALEHAVGGSMEHRQDRLARAGNSLARAVSGLLSQSTETLDGFDRELHAVSPLEVLRRGYSVTLGPDGRVLREPGDVAPGARLTTRLADGEVRSVVEGGGAKPVPASPAGRSASRSVRKPRQRGRDASQLDLFGKGEYRREDQSPGSGGGS